MDRPFIGRFNDRLFVYRESFTNIHTVTVIGGYTQRVEFSQVKSGIPGSDQESPSVRFMPNGEADLCLDAQSLFKKCAAFIAIHIVAPAVQIDSQRLVFGELYKCCFNLGLTCFQVQSPDASIVCAGRGHHP
jgi:hypothetical protein